MLPQVFRSRAIITMYDLYLKHSWDCLGVNIGIKDSCTQKKEGKVQLYTEEERNGTVVH